MEAEEYFRRFRDDMLPYSPFLHFPPSMTAMKLREDRPFLWLVIMSIGLRTFPRQSIVTEEVRNIIAQKLIVEHERSLDLLQGLLVYLTWYVCVVSGPPLMLTLHRCQYARRNRPFIAMYARLAISLVIDLDLHGPPPKAWGWPVCWQIPLYKDVPPPDIPQSASREAGRAVLGCFAISSMLVETSPPRLGC